MKKSTHTHAAYTWLALHSAQVGALNNAFKFRRLFATYDTTKTGRVQIEDFRNMAEQFGMQLDDDSLLALFNVRRPGW
jgi:Ca2+-binding EF-hand superfamily protein